MAGPAAPHRLVLAFANLALPGRMSPLCTQRSHEEAAYLGALTRAFPIVETSLRFKVRGRGRPTRKRPLERPIR